MKNFDEWNETKKEVDSKNKIIGFNQFEIVFVKMGVNVGFEQDGKGKEFLRPVLVYKKFNNRVFLGIPLSSQKKSGKFCYNFNKKR